MTLNHSSGSTNPTAKDWEDISYTLKKLEVAVSELSATAKIQAEESRVQALKTDKVYTELLGTNLGKSGGVLTRLAEVEARIKDQRTITGVLGIGGGGIVYGVIEFFRSFLQ